MTRYPWIGAARSTNTVALLGDSLTVNNFATDLGAAAPYIASEDRGPWTWAAMRLQGRARLLGAFGYSGNTVAQIRTRAAEALASGASWIVVLAGTNDILQGVPTATTQAELGLLWDQLIAGGRKVVALTIPPSGTNAANYGPTLRLNNWIKRQATARPGLIVCDAGAPLFDLSTGGPRTGMLTSDNIHLGAQGAFLMGQRLAQVLDPLLPKLDVLPSSSADPDNFFNNSAMTGDVSGVATGYGASASAGLTYTASKVARTDEIPGEWQQFVAAGTTTGDGLQFFQNKTTDIVAGDQLYAMVEFEVGNDVVWLNAATRQTLLRVELAAVITPAFTTLLRVLGNNHLAPNALGSTYRVPSGVIVTPVLTIPETTNRLNLNILFNGTGTVRFGRVAVRKVGSGPLI